MISARKLFLLALVVVIPGIEAKAIAGNEDVTVVRHRPAEGENDHRSRYFLEILQLALEKTREDHGDFRLEVTDLAVSQERALKLIERDRLIDVVWTMTNREREQHALPVRIPLMKGLMGWRVLLVRRSEVERFLGITDIRELGELVGVQGEGWPDTDILRDNGLNIVTSTDYEGMFSMIEHGRADYFPRSVLEAGPELEAFQSLDIAVAPIPVLTYIAPIYFFVNKDNHALATRLKTGLERAIVDGSFDQVFRNQPGFEHIESFARNTSRFLRLENSGLPPETPINRKVLWYGGIDWKAHEISGEHRVSPPSSE